jgi:DNA invertase Pin-like site-specific DNA recombinase
MERIAIYARVSTAEQNTDIQRTALRRYARRRGAEAVEFIDHGISGSQASRPKLDEMMAALRRREFSAVVVTKLDRIARSLRHLTEMGAELEALGVALVVLDQSIDTSTPTGRLLFNILGTIAEFERDLLRERINQGMKAAKARGVKVGRPQALDREGRARARRLRSKGKSIRAIAEQLDVGVGTIARTLAQT